MKVAALYDVHGMPWTLEAVAELRHGGWPEAERSVAENLLVPASRAEAVAFFEAQNG